MIYDQLMVTNLASAESLCRIIQVQEERYRDQLGGEDSENHHLYMGTDLTRGNVCVCPSLSDYVKDALAKEYQIAKERRKAREERSLARPKAGDKGDKG